MECSASVGPSYVPDGVERVGRRLKMEYVGMASVFAVILALFSTDLPLWPTAVAGTGATFFLFLGLKKKTRDHLVTSFLMIAAATLAHAALRAASWARPFLFFGFCVYALEGYLEKRQKRIFALPFIFWFWVAADPSWLLGLVYIGLYLTHPWSERPGLRRQLLWVWLASIGVSLISLGVQAGFARPVLPARLPLDGSAMILLACLGIPALLCLVTYWSVLKTPHRLTAILFGLLAPWDLRMLAAFAVPATVLIGATVLQQSADSLRLRVPLKHAEWYFFWVIFAVALGVWVAKAQLV